MRKFVISLVLITAFVFLSIGLVSAQDEDANQILLPGLLDGETLADEFETTTDAQIFAFNGSEGDVVTITLEQTADAAIDPLLVLLGEAGQVIGYNDDSDNADLASLASEISEVELPFDGTYFVLATTLSGLRGSEGDDTGAPYAYEITASGFTTPEEMGAEDLRYAGVEVEYGQSGELQITEEEPVFFVTFVGSEGDVVDIRTTVGSEEGQVSDTLLYVFDSTGRRLAVNDDSDGFAAELLGVELPEDGKYLVFATSYGFNDVENSGGLFSVGTFGLTIDAE